MNVIEIRELNKKFETFVAIDNISLEIQEGEIYGLLGPNGAGKSTAIAIICGLLKPTSGEIKILDVDVTKSMRGQNKKIGYVPQEIALYSEFTAYENLKFFGELYGLRGIKLKEKIEYALEFTGLLEQSKKIVGKFSGGMKRRLNIACAIMHDPKIIIMDEPTVGIDPQSRNLILEAVKKLNKKGTTVIYTTHYMEEISAICTKIAIMDHGNIIVTGTEEELKSLISDFNVLEVEIIGDNFNIDGINDVIGVTKFEVKENKVSIFSEKEVSNLNKIIEFLGDRDIKISNIGFKDITLETVFLSLTGRSLRD